METVGVIFVLVALGLLVLQILMIAKFFQIAADVRGMKDLLAEHYKKESETSQKEDSIVGTQPSYAEITIPSYQVDGECVTFEDGLRGNVLEKFGAFSFEDLQGKRIYCKTQEEAVKGLYYILTHHSAE